MIKNNFYCDSHLHIENCGNFENVECALKELGDTYQFASCAHSIKEWEFQARFHCVKTFGIHPQSFTLKDVAYDYNTNISFLQELLKSGKISAIGEVGFDLFNNEYKATLDYQARAWEEQLALAINYNLPLVIHCRKGFDQLLKDSRTLAKLPAALFHSFSGNIIQAGTILSKGVNAYFSFGKQLLNGNKKATLCVKELPLDKVLLETDAPYQTLKGEPFTKICDIKKVYRAAYNIRGCNTPFYDFCEALQGNFIKLYNVGATG